MRRSSHHKKQNSRRPLATTKWQALLISYWLGGILFLAFGFLAFIIYKIFTLDRFIYVNRSEVGDAEIIIVDPKLDQIQKYIILANTELDASNGYGNYKVKSLWVLSEKDEKKGGILTDTIIKNYSLPVYLWKNGGESNLSFLQNLKVLFIKSEGKELKDSDYINFMDLYFAENIKSIEVRDMTGDAKTIDKVSKLIETLGGKITLNSKGYEKDLDCIISGKDKIIVNSINKLFNCEIENVNTESKDLYLKLGAKFAERF